MTTQLDAEKQRSAQLDQHLAEEKARVARLSQELKDAHRAKIQAEKDRDEARSAKAAAEGQAQAQRQRADEAKARYDEQLRHLTEHADEVVRAEKQKRMAALDAELVQLRAEADQAAEQRLSEARARAAELEAQARRHAAELETTADGQRKEAEAAAREARDTARRESADLLNRTREETARLRLAAESEAKAQRREAEEVLARARAEAAQELAERTHALDVAENAVAARELAVRQRTAELERRQRQLDALDDDLRADQQRLDAERRSLRDAEARLGPDAIERLERQIAELEDRLAAAREQHRTVAAENDRLRGELEEIGGTGAGARLAEMERLREALEAARAELAQRPEPLEAENLRALAASADALKAQLADERRIRLDMERAQEQADAVVQQARAEARRVERAKQAVEAELQCVAAERDALQVTQAQAERAARELQLLQVELDAARVHAEHLNRQLAMYTETARAQLENRFGRVAKLTDETPSGLPAPTDAPPLDALVNDIRHAMATGVGGQKTGQAPRPLYYDDHTVRAFLGSLACADLTLLQGPSGTGKTSLPQAIGEVIGAHIVTIPVQAGWRDRSDLLGYYNAFTRSFRGTEFTEAVYRAGLPDFADRPVFVVLDECNLSQMEYYFADLLSKLENWNEAPSIRLFEESIDGDAPARLIEGHALPLPRNVRYFGTANQDETTCGIADKTYDRASVLLLEERAKPFSPSRRVQRHALRWSSLTQRFDAACKVPPYDGKRLHGFVAALEKHYMRDFGFGLGNRFEERIIGRFLPVYVAAGGKASDGLDHLVRSRIVRRLDRLRDPALAPALRNLDALLEKQWPCDEGEALTSRAALDHLLSRVSN